MRKPVLVPIVAGLALGAVAFTGSAAAAAVSAEQSAPAVADPIGPGCASAGNVSTMASAPMSTAASSSPELSTLSSAIQRAGMEGRLNSARDITMFAPTNAAFAKIPQAELNRIMGDRATLTDTLNYHVVGQRLSPQSMTSGTFRTLQGGTIRTSGSGQSYRVNDANVVCGNLETTNGTLYLIDSVLTPQR